MGKLDQAVYSYLSRCDRFADLFNVSLFHGEQVLCPELLTDSSERCIMKDKDGDYKDTDRVKKEEVYIEEKGEYDMCQALTELIEDGKQEGIKEGLKEGENRLLRLQRFLIAEGKMDELNKVILDEMYRQKMYCKYAVD